MAEEQSKASELARAWATLARSLGQHELMEEIDTAHRHGIDLPHSIYAGTVVRALADCSRCQGGCRLWFIEDSEAPSEVCPHFDHFAYFAS